MKFDLIYNSFSIVISELVKMSATEEQNEV